MSDHWLEEVSSVSTSSQVVTPCEAVLEWLVTGYVWKTQLVLVNEISQAKRNSNYVSPEPLYCPHVVER